MKLHRSLNSYTVTGTVALIVGGYVANYLRRIPFSSLEAGLGPAFFPAVLTVLIVLLGVIALIFGFIKAGTGAADIEPMHQQTVGMVTAVVLFGFAISHIGLLIPTVLFLLLTMFFLGAGIRYTLIGTAIASTGIYLLFGVVLRIRMFW